VADAVSVVIFAYDAQDARGAWVRPALRTAQRVARVSHHPVRRERRGEDSLQYLVLARPPVIATRYELRRRPALRGRTGRGFR
jgi:hypothetical protein